MNIYMLYWTGMDRSEHEDEVEATEAEIKAKAVYLMEHGAHCISIVDVDGNEVEF